MVTLNAYTFDEISMFTLFLRTGFDGYFNPGRPQKAAFEIVASLVFFEDRVIGRFLGLHHFDGVMDMRIKGLSRCR